MKNFCKTSFMVSVVTALTLGTGPIHAQEKRQLDSHEHGHVTLQIAIEGNTLSMALEAPGESIVGFEHEATTDEQKNLVSAAQKKLENPSSLFVATDAAGCKVASAKAELHQEGEHNAFEAAYTFECSNMSKLTTIETQLFKVYPSIDEIEVEYATPAGQGAQELEPDRAVVALPSTN